MSRGGGCAIALAIALAVIAPGSAPAWADGDAAATAAAAGDDGAGDAGAGDDAAAPPHLLRWTALIGLGGIVVGGTPLLWTYGSPKVTTWTVPLAVLGTGGLLTAGAAALWGVTGGARRAGAAGADAPWQLEAGTTWVADPLFAEAAYLRLAGAWRRGRLAVAPSALVAIDGDAQRGEVEARWRLRGAAPGAGVIASGTRLELRGDAFAIRRAGFAVVTGELGLRGRLDLGRVAPALDGAFGEAGVGLGLEVTRYDAGDLDATELVTARFGLGLYLGCGQGEALLWYEHRRDDLAGGLAAWRAAGFIGRAGLTGAWSLTPRWAIAAEVQAGSAWVTTLAVRRRGGAR